MRQKQVARACFLLGLAALACCGAEQPLAQWSFDRPGNSQGWQANSHLADLVVTNGALSCRAIGPDPIFEFIPLLNFKASPRQVVEIRLRADQDGTAELFWSNTSTGRYSGFAQEKSTRFNVRGDNAWHTYRLLPCWQREQNIIRLRFDVYDASRFDWASLRVVELDSPAAAEHNDIDFNRDPKMWRWFEPLGQEQSTPAWNGSRLKEGVTSFG